VVVHLYTPPSPNYGEGYPRPHQHDQDAGQQERLVASGAQTGPSFRMGN
jgi:hypothetical protein